MNKTPLLLFGLSIALLLLATTSVSALSFSQSYNQDLVRVRERWSYTEDTTGKLRGFNLVHTYVVPRQTAQIIINDKPSNINTQTQTVTTTGRSGGLTLGTFGSITSNAGSFGSSSNTGVGLSSGFGSNSNSFGSVGGSFSNNNEQAVRNAFDTFRQNNRQPVNIYTNGYYRFGY